MKKDEIHVEQYVRIMDCAMQTLIKFGFKGTTMDYLAASLQMSKRTLYEIFDTKDNLIRETHQYFHKKMVEKLAEIFSTSQNVMEAIIKCFLYNRDVMSKLSVDFIKDMQTLINRTGNLSSSKCRQHYHNLYDVLQRGVNEGYFRNDVNLMVQCRMLTLQMESLKSFEDLFPEDISLLEVYDSISLGFLRGISSPKGLEELEKFMPYFTSFSSKKENNV